MSKINLFDYYEDIPNSARLVADFQISDDHARNIWEKLVLKMEGDPLNVVKRRFQVMEASLLNHLKSKGVDIYDRRGKPSFKKVCPKSTYRTAKSIIIRAVENGVDLLDANKTPLGKTALERKIREKVDPPKQQSLPINNAGIQPFNTKGDETMPSTHLINAVRAAKGRFEKEINYNKWIDDAIDFLEKSKK